MRWKHACFTGALALLSAGLRADVQSRLDVVANALAASKHLQIQRLAVTGFANASSGQRDPFADTLEADLRTAAKAVKKWSVIADGDTATTPDAVLTGTYVRDGDSIAVHVQVEAQPEGTVLWQRDTVLDGADVDVKDLPAAAAAPAAEAAPGPAGAVGPGDTVPLGGGAELGAADSGEGDTIPTLPRHRRRWAEPWGTHIDFSIAYKAFFPTNSTFQSAAGNRFDGLSLGFNFNDVFLWDFDFWGQNINGLGTVQSLTYAGTDLAVVFPVHAGPWTFYLGPGGRFGSIDVNDPGLNNGGATFGNNGLTAVAGAKWTVDNVGLDLRYTYDLVASYTGYNTARIGAFYEFGR